MNFSLKILESDSQIRSLILNEIKNTLERAINKAIPKIITDIKKLIVSSLKSEPEYTSLTSGQLKAELGIPDTAQVDAVINLMVETLSVNKSIIKTNQAGLSGGFILTMLESSTLGGVVSSVPAYVKDAKGYSLPWLEWLCLRNNEIIVKDFSVKYGSDPNSRSGMAIMIPSSDSWRVPPVFVGSKDKNWTTRAIDRSEAQIYSIIQTNIKDHI
jgi:hypothetical protein